MTMCVVWSRFFMRMTPQTDGQLFLDRYKRANNQNVDRFFPRLFTSDTSNGIKCGRVLKIIVTTKLDEIKTRWIEMI